MTSSPKQPKYINHGTYGCVFAPAVDCDKKIASKHVSKLFSDSKEATKEKQIYNAIVKKLDKDNVFTIKLHDKCKVPRKLFKSEEIDKCANWSMHTKMSAEIMQLVYENGGMNLREAAVKVPFATLFKAMWRLFEGLTILGKKKFVHLDIKADNIVYNQAEDKMALIDFGLLKHFDQVYVSETDFILNFTYAWYPSEFLSCSDYFHKRSLVNDFVHDPSVKTTDNLAEFKKKIGNVVLKEVAKEWNSLLDVDIKDLKLFLASNMNDLPANLSKYTDKIDVYMLGTTIAYVMAKSYENNLLKIGLKDVGFYKKVIALVKNMIHINPTKRFNAIQAYNEYKAITGMTSPVSPKPSLKRVAQHHVNAKKENEKPPCPPGKIRNPKTGRCIKDKTVTKVVTKKTPKPCPPGKVRNPATGRCINDKTIVKPCPPGKIRNPKTGRCIKDTRAVA